MAYNRANGNQRNNDRVRYEVIENIGVLARKDSGWTREVNLISWNGAPAKIDIREWDPEHARMAKGITLLEAEAEMLAKMLVRRYGIRTGAPAAAVGEAAESAIADAAPAARAMDDGTEMAGAYASDDAAYETAASDAGTTDGLMHEEDTDEEGDKADTLN